MNIFIQKNSMLVAKYSISKRTFICIFLILSSTLVKAQDYQQPLNALNDYLKKFNNGYYEGVTVDGEKITIKSKGGYACSFFIDEVDGAEPESSLQCVNLACIDRKKCMIEQSYDAKSQLYTFIDYNRKPFNYSELANLLNGFLYALKGLPVPFKYIYIIDIDKASDSSKITNPKTIQLNSSSSLKQAVLDLEDFLKNKISSSGSYFNGVDLSGNSLKIRRPVGYEEIRLNLVGDVVYDFRSCSVPCVKINSNGGYCYYNTWNDNYFEKNTWSDFKGEDLEKFYVLLGNIIDAYKTENMKKYKVYKSYLEKLNLIKKDSFLHEINRDAIVRIEDVSKNDPSYRKMKKLIGTEMRVNYLFINSDCESYNGSLYLEKHETIALSQLKVKFIKDVEGNNLIAYKKRLLKTNEVEEVSSSASGGPLDRMSKEIKYKRIIAILEEKGYKHKDNGSAFSAVPEKKIEGLDVSYNIELKKEYLILGIGKDLIDISTILNGKDVLVESEAISNGYLLDKTMNLETANNFDFIVVNFKIKKSDKESNRITVKYIGSSSQLIDVYLLERK